MYIALILALVYELYDEIKTFPRFFGILLLAGIVDIIASFAIAFIYPDLAITIGYMAFLLYFIMAFIGILIGKLIRWVAIRK